MAEYRSQPLTWVATAQLASGKVIFVLVAVVERRGNVANNNIYTKTINESLPQRETEILSAKDLLNETIMISLKRRKN
jgi:hypothetical protein